MDIKGGDLFTYLQLYWNYSSHVLLKAMKTKRYFCDNIYLILHNVFIKQV